MTHTPIPTPIPVDTTYLVVCDGCLTSAKVLYAGDIPLGWERVQVEGWVGSFHACSGRCQERIIATHSTKS